ncbi:hypothetical protein Pyn_08560 [Prunus yedoensis var. nudiflora]|uniref:Uncharacterized protein n=1 Tax=Prunus yedoensis var. nudiflora TaxID=2094558 RepID=A0A314UAB1_PRUYE|nr:hypothetical protein Pyn_08560 [Prunus yedoensis var. nudiflora]
MGSLQRSSMSFRRQGSSGRIWEDRVPVFDQKQTSFSGPICPTFSGPIRPPFSGVKSFEHHPNFDENFQEREFVDSNYARGLPSPPKQEHKVVQRCSLSSLFGRCMGSPTAA